jgi:hypothetical protein
MDRAMIDWLLHDIDNFQIELGRTVLGEHDSIYYETKRVLYRLSESLAHEDWLGTIIAYNQIKSIYEILTDLCTKDNQLSEIRYRLNSILYILGGYVDLLEKTIHEILKKEKENGQEHDSIIIE